MTLEKWEKKIVKRLYRQMPGAGNDPIAVSLAEQIRTLVDGEDVVEFGFIEFEDWETDSEIEAWFDEHVRRRIPSYMYWDCTGCLFTWDISWKRNPNGLVSFVHRMSLDV